MRLRASSAMLSKPGGTRTRTSSPRPLTLRISQAQAWTPAVPVTRAKPVMLSMAMKIVSARQCAGTLDQAGKKGKVVFLRKAALAWDKMRACSATQSTALTYAAQGRKVGTRCGEFRS
jgi:hypothetical protein